MNPREALGVDLGGVIIVKWSDDLDTSFSTANYLETPMVAGAFEALRRLADERFGEHVYVVSRAGRRGQTKSLRWMKHHGFYEATSVKKSHVHFCLERDEKDPICRTLGITHFVDDRLDVLLNLRTVPHRYLLRTTDREGRWPPHLRVPTAIEVVDGWEAIGQAMFRPSSRQR